MGRSDGPTTADWVVPVIEGIADDAELVVIVVTSLIETRLDEADVVVVASRVSAAALSASSFSLSLDAVVVGVLSFSLAVVAGLSLPLLPSCALAVVTKRQKIINIKKARLADQLEEAIAPRSCLKKKNLGYPSKESLFHRGKKSQD